MFVYMFVFIRVDVCVYVCACTCVQRSEETQLALQEEHLHELQLLLEDHNTAMASLQKSHQLQLTAHEETYKLQLVSHEEAQLQLVPLQESSQHRMECRGLQKVALEELNSLSQALKEAASPTISKLHDDIVVLQIDHVEVPHIEVEFECLAVFDPDDVSALKEVVLQDTARHCNTLQLAATGCKTLQNTAWGDQEPQHTDTQQHTLQHTTIHCNTLQHTTSHCIAL